MRKGKSDTPEKKKPKTTITVHRVYGSRTFEACFSDYARLAVDDIWKKLENEEKTEQKQD